MCATMSPYIIQILPNLDEGGAEQSTVDIAAALSKTTAKQLVISGGGALVQKLTEYGCQHLIIPNLGSRNPFITSRNYHLLDKVFQSTTPHLVHARSRIPAWLAYFLSKKYHFPWISTWHGTHKTKNILKKIYNTSLLRADICITTNDIFKEKIIHHYPHYTTPLRVIPRGINTDYFNPLNISKNRREQCCHFLNIRRDNHLPYIFIVPGRITGWKGQLFALQTFKKLLSLPTHKNWHCFFIGSDITQHKKALKKLIQETNKLHLQKYVSFVGHCHDMPSAYALADCVVIPSLRPEPFGRTVAEAQAMKKPTIALHAPLGNTHFKDGFSGFIPAYKTPLSLAQKIAFVMQLPKEEQAHIGEIARDTIVKFYSITSMQIKTLKIYDEMLRRRGWDVDLTSEFSQALYLP